MTTRLIKVLLPIPFDQAFTYSIPDEAAIEPGTLVCVNFRSRDTIGVVWETNVQELNIKYKVKPILFFYDEVPPLSKAILRFVEWVSQYNMAPLGMALKLVLSLDLKQIAMPWPLIDFEEYSIDHTKALKHIKLNNEQLAAYAIISHKIEQSQHCTILLEGVTGCGKTEVYMKAIEDVLAQGKQALVLLPEIVLTSQLVERFQKAFCTEPGEWHSSATKKTKRIIWHGVANGKVNLVIGARSSLFLPFQNLSIIVVDEEHDSSFKQEEGVIYNARDMAVLRASIENIPIILSSATPSMETLYNVSLGKYTAVNIKNRFGSAKLPKVDVIDLKVSKCKAGTWLSLEVRAELIKTKNAGQQSILFINRRGYAPINMCTECGYKVSCKHCSVALVEHKRTGMLHCHYCGFKMDRPSSCPECDNDEALMISSGPGVERISDEVLSFIHDAQIQIMTSDTIKNKKQASEAIEKIESGEVDIILGTQMISKGLHFPKLKLVCVVDSDFGLSGGDIRAIERTYQMLRQVSGRAGRESSEGVVLLQTYDPDNELIKTITGATSNEDFFEMELLSRKLFDMPPYTKMAIVTMTSPREELLMTYTQKAARAIPALYTGIRVMGPAPCPIYQMRDYYRHRFLIIANRNVNLQFFIRNWLNQIIPVRGIDTRIDMDPYNFL